jgi:hypothetical protein
MGCIISNISKKTLDDYDHHLLEIDIASIALTLTFCNHSKNSKKLLLEKLCLVHQKDYRIVKRIIRDLINDVKLKVEHKSVKLTSFYRMISTLEVERRKISDERDQLLKDIDTEFLSRGGNIYKVIDWMPPEIVNIIMNYRG